MRIYFRSVSSPLSDVYGVIVPETPDELDYPFLRLRICEGQAQNGIPQGVARIMGPDGWPTTHGNVIRQMLSNCSFDSPIIYEPTPPAADITVLADRLNNLEGTVSSALRLLNRPRATSSSLAARSSSAGTSSVASEGSPPL